MSLGAWPLSYGGPSVAERGWGVFVHATRSEGCKSELTASLLCPPPQPPPAVDLNVFGGRGQIRGAVGGLDTMLWCC